MASIKNMVLRVQFDADTEPVEVQTVQFDYVMWDITAHKQKWPGAAEGPFLWATYIGWQACRRLKLTDAKWEDFQSTVFAVQPQEELETVDPIQ